MDTARPAPNYHPLTLEIMDMIGDKWTLLVTYTLEHGALRFSDLKRQAKPISSKMLTQTLRGLESYGMVRRTVLNTTPPSVEYALTDLGQSFLVAAGVICAWTRDHCDALDLARNSWNADND